MKFTITEEEKRSIRSMYLLEQDEKQIAGPFGNDIQKFYIFSKGGKFCIYQTNASQKTPILMGGTLGSNTGKGYDTQEEANKIIQDQVHNQQTGHEETPDGFGMQ